LEEAMALSFEFVNNCKPGDLLRVKIEDTAEFSILGANEGHGLRALVVLKDNEPPFVINLLESGRIDGDFETYAALVYGKCEILPGHTDRCEIGIGPLFTNLNATPSPQLFSYLNTTIRPKNLAHGIYRLKTPLAPEPFQALNHPGFLHK
jgi:hypothetical protein